MVVGIKAPIPIITQYILQIVCFGHSSIMFMAAHVKDMWKQILLVLYCITELVHFAAYSHNWGQPFFKVWVDFI